MPITRDDVHHVALLARLHLTEEEERAITEQLDQILDYVRVLDALDTAAVEPTAHIAPLATPFRDDVVTSTPDRARWMANAPAADGVHFRVPRIIE